MATHSRSKNGVASLADVPAIHAFLRSRPQQDVDARVKPAHDDRNTGLPSRYGNGGARRRMTA